MMSGRSCSKWGKKSKRVKRFFSEFGFRLNIGAAILLFLAYLAPFVPPDYFWPLAFFGLAYPYLLILNLLFLLFWIFFRSKRILLPLVSILLGGVNIINTYQLIPSSGTKAQGINVLSYNVHGFKFDQRAHRTDNPGILGYFKSTGAEIICLQEGLQFQMKKLTPQGIKEALPEINYFHFATDSNYSDLITLSKFPIINKGEIKFSGRAVLVIFSDIQINNRRIIRVYNCHLQSYSIDPDDYSSIDSIGSVSNSRQIAEARKISYKLRAGFRLRAFQARRLADHMLQSPYPVVVCGDFNDTPVSYVYRKVRGNLKDAFVESGFGTSNTYNGVLPSFRIDYILANQNFELENYRRDLVQFSDHFPVRCRLIPKGSPITK